MNKKKIWEIVTLKEAKSDVKMCYTNTKLGVLFQIWCSHYTPEYMQKSILVDEHSIAKFRWVINQAFLFSALLKRWSSVEIP